MRGIVSKIWRVVIVLVPILFSVFTVVIGILGIVAYGKNGWFPCSDMLFDALKGAEGKIIHHASDAWDFMLTDPFSYVWMVYFFVSYIISVIMSYCESIIRGIIATLAFGTIVGGAAYLFITSPNMGMWSDTKNAVVMAVFILMVIITIIALKGSDAGAYMKATLIISLGYFLIVPLAMWFWTLDTAGKIGTIVGVVVYIFLWSAGGDIIMGVGGNPSSSPAVMNKSNDGKIRQKIATLENDIKANKRGLEGHRRREIGYKHVDVKTTHNTINSKMKERDFWKKQLAK